MKVTFARILQWLCLALTAGTLHAQGNLVANGGFEIFPAGWEGSYGYIGNADFAFEGTGVGVVDDLGSSSVGKTMYQLLSTEPAAPYYLRFSLLSGAGRAGEQSPPGASPVAVRWGGRTIAQVANASTTDWKTYQYQVIATSSQTELNFQSLGTRWQLIDGISVTLVPEPHTTWLLAMSVVALAFRKRRTAA